MNYKRKNEKSDFPENILSKSYKSIKLKEENLLSKNDKKNFPNSKFLTNVSPIEVVPPEIFFRDIIADQTYEMVVFVRNLSKRQQRIRVLQPNLEKFR